MKLDKFHKHEALDRTHVALDSFSEYIYAHPFIQRNPELLNTAYDIERMLGKLHQSIAATKVKK